MVNRKFTVQAVLCLVGCLHLIAFSSLLIEYPVLYGRHGVRPASVALRTASQAQQASTGSALSARIFHSPSLLWFHSSLGLTAEAMFAAVCFAGVAVSLAAACGKTHPLAFAALWVLYLSVINVEHVFLWQPGDEVLLEVTFACVWLAAATYQAQHKPEQQQQLSRPVVLALKWLLFKLLLVDSSLSAVRVCSAVPGLDNCFRALVAHGQPHSWTRFLQSLPSPIASVAAALLLLELPAAFLVLIFAPSAQHATARWLLLLQIAKIILGPASLTNLAAAALSVLLLDDGILVPVLAKLGQKLGWWQGGAAEVGQAGAELLAYKAAAGQHGLKRSNSMNSLGACSFFTEDFVPLSDEAGSQTLLAKLKNDRWMQAVVAGGGITMAIMFGYSSSTGLVLRPQPQQIKAALQALAPVAIVWWAAAMIDALLAAVKPTAGAASATEAAALDEAEEEHAEVQESVVDDAVDEWLPTEKPKFMAPPPDTPGSLCKVLKLRSPAPRSPFAAQAIAAAAGVANGHLANGNAELHDEQEHSDQAGSPVAAPAPHRGGRKGVTGTARRSGRAGRTAGAAAADSEDSAGHSTPRGRGRPAVGKGRKAAAPAEVEEEPTAQDHAQEPAAVSPGATLAAAATAVAFPSSTAGSIRARGSGIGGGILAVLALGIFVASLHPVLLAAGYRADSLSALPVLPSSYHLAHRAGIVSDPSKSIAVSDATTTAAGLTPGSFLVYEYYTFNESDATNWHQVTFKKALGSPELSGSTGVLQQLWVMRGLSQPRLQAKLATAASSAEPDWLLSLASKVVEGAPVLSSVLHEPVGQSDWVAVKRARYTASFLHQPGAMPAAVIKDGWAWGLHEPDADVLILGRLHDVYPKVVEASRADDGSDGVLVQALEQTVAGLEPGVVILVLLLAVAARHMLLRGGLVQLCTSAATGRE